MIKKFKKFRDKLTYKQLEKILIVVGIIIAILFIMGFVFLQPWNNCYSWEKEIPWPLMAVITLFMLEFSCLMLIWVILGGIDKSVIYESEQIDHRLNTKFKENEMLEVYFLPRELFGGNREEIFRAPYEIFGLTYVAYKEEDKVIVKLMQGEKELDKYVIKNLTFFEKKL